MRSTTCYLAGLAALVACGNASAQPAFTNLNFESAVIVPIPGDPYARVQAPQAFPGWTAYAGGVQQNAALFNNMFLDSTGIGLIGSGWTYGGQIAGNYTAFLQGGLMLGT